MVSVTLAARHGMAAPGMGWAWAWAGQHHSQGGQLGGPGGPRARAPQPDPPRKKLWFFGWVRYMFTESLMEGCCGTDVVA